MVSFDLFFIFEFEKRFPLLKSKGKVFDSPRWKKVFNVIFILEFKKGSTLKTLTKKLYRRFRCPTGDQKISEERQSLRWQTSININSVNDTKLLLHMKPHKIVGTICNNNNVFIFEKHKVKLRDVICVTRRENLQFELIFIIVWFIVHTVWHNDI